MRLPPSNQIRVLHIFGRMDRGGAEMRTVELLRVLDQSKFAFEFCALSGLRGELDHEIEVLGGKVHPVKLGICFPWKFLSLLRTRRYDAVHSHVHYFTGFILLLAAAGGVPQRIAHFRSTADGKGGHSWRRARNAILKYLVNLCATDIVGVSKAALELSMGPGCWNDARCQVIYNGITVKAYQAGGDRTGVRTEFGVPDDATLLIHVGRMDPAKNHERLIRIFYRFSLLVPNTWLLLVGKRTERIEARVRVIAHECKLLDRILFVGLRTDVPRLLAGADLMLFPSLREGLPGAVLEAAAAGVPVLASNIPGILEINEHIPEIQAISLAYPDDEWALRALTLLGRRNSPATSYGVFPPLFDVNHSRGSFECLYTRLRLRERVAA
jgi:glycosyltransferase involved in cell wall biosynthesis